MFIPRVSVPVANHGLHRHNINCRTLDTAGFFGLVPVFYKHLLQGESVNIQGSVFSRTNPLLQAAFVTGSYNYRWFFVPYRTVWPAFVDFQNSTPHTYSNGSSSGPIQKSCYFSDGRLSLLFCSDGDCCSAATSSNYDIAYYDGSTTTYYNIEAWGACVLKVLQGLGYTLSFNSSGSDRNAFALLSFLKVYIDWYWPSQYIANPVYELINSMLHLDTPSQFQHVDESDLLLAIKTCVFSFYSNDEYNHMWQTPYQAGASNDVPSIVVHDSSQNLASVDDTVVTNSTTSVNTSGTGNNTPAINQKNVVSGNTVNLYKITQYAIDALQNVSNFMRRLSLVGSRAVDRFLVERGQKMNPVVSNRSLRLSEQVIPLHVGDVENNSDTNLGELAGKGIARTTEGHHLSCDFEASEDGVLICLRTIIPDGGLVTKNDPFNFYTLSLDFYHGEFEKQGVEAVPSAVLFNFFNGTRNSSSIGDRVFGFWRRYFGYVANRNIILGDFNIKSRGAATLNQFHSFREISESELTLLVNPSISLNFINAFTDGGQYNRIFYSDKSDNFITLQEFVGSHKSLVPPLGDSFDWDDDEFNRKVDMQVGGSKVQ